VIGRLLGLLRGDSEKRLRRQAAEIGERSEKALKESEATRLALEQIRGVEQIAGRDR
jgi:hypothetical protein